MVNEKQLARRVYKWLKQTKGDLNEASRLARVDTLRAHELLIRYDYYSYTPVIGRDTLYVKKDDTMTNWFRELVTTIKDILSDGEYHTMKELQEKLPQFKKGQIRRALKWMNSNWRYIITESYKMEDILGDE